MCVSVGGSVRCAGVCECGRECEGEPVCVSVGGSVRVCRCV